MLYLTHNVGSTSFFSFSILFNYSLFLKYLQVLLNLVLEKVEVTCKVLIYVNKINYTNISKNILLMNLIYK